MSRAEQHVAIGWDARCLVCNTCGVNRDARRERLIAAGQWLRDQRQRRGFPTAAEFARRLDIDRAVLSNYERGVNAIDDERAEQIAEVLGMDLIEVRRNLGLWVPPESSEQPAEPQTWAELNEVIQSDPELARAVLDLMRMAARKDPPAEEHEQHRHRDAS